MDILYRDVPENIYNLVADKICQLSKERKRKVSQSETISYLLKKAYLEVPDSLPPNAQVAMAKDIRKYG